MDVDVLLTSGTIVDGSGRGSFVADVGVKGDEIAAVGDLSDANARVRVDCTGMTVAPGFIDIHTHYDAPILWDHDLTPSSWFGVTTVLFGNCSFSVAPCHDDPQAHNWAIGILETAEGMTREVLEAGIGWQFSSFAEYLDGLRTEGVALNVGAMVGHSMLRLYAMGESAFTREATPSETSTMQQALRDALDAGAFGFSTSRAGHVAFGGPIPSRLSTTSEVFEIASVLRELESGIMQVIGGPQFDIPEFAQLAEYSKRPVTWTPLRTRPRTKKHWEQLALTEQYQEQGLQLWPQVSCEPFTFEMNFAEPFMLEVLPAFGKLHGATYDQRVDALYDVSWLKAVRDQLLNNESMDFSFDRIFVSESPTHPSFVGRSIFDIADEVGKDGMDAMAEIILSDGLATRFRTKILDYDDDEVGQLLKRPSVLLGLSDAGAHFSQICDAGFATYLLSHWVRDRKELSLEKAVAMLTGHLAEALGLKDRGRLAAGLKADICVFDAGTINQQPLERVHDLPSGGDRLIRRPIGISHVLVNGKFIQKEGRPTGVRPGRVLSSTASF